MKKAVFYYSYDGSSAIAADVIAKKTGADIVELKEARERKKSKAGFMGAAFGAVFNAQSKLKQGILEKLADYEGIIAITPVWASKTTPAVNRLLAQRLTDKQLWAVTVQADPECKGSEKILESIKNRTQQSGGVYQGGISIVGAEPGKTASAQELEKQLEDFISKL